MKKLGTINKKIARERHYIKCNECIQVAGKMVFFSRRFFFSNSVLVGADYFSQCNIGHFHVECGKSHAFTFFGQWL